MEVDGDRIVDAGADASGLEAVEDTVALGDSVDAEHADHVEVPDVLIAGEASGRHDAGDTSKQGVVAGGSDAALGVPVVEAAQLGPQDRGLDGVEP